MIFRLYRRIVRIENAALRIALCLLAEPFLALHRVVTWSMPVAWGGHPDGRRIFARDVWQIHFALFWAACMGYFVDLPIDGAE